MFSLLWPKATLARDEAHGLGPEISLPGFGTPGTLERRSFIENSFASLSGSLGIGKEGGHESFYIAAGKSCWREKEIMWGEKRPKFAEAPPQ